MGAIRAIGDIACVVLAVVGVLVMTAFGYYITFNDDVTIGVNNIDDQVALDIIEKIENENDLTQEQIDAYKDRYFMNFNYYDNSKNNGVELAELRFDYFTSYRLQSIDYRSTGMQALGKYYGNSTVGADGSLDNLGFVNIFGNNDRTISDATTAVIMLTRRFIITILQSQKRLFFFFAGFTIGALLIISGFSCPSSMVFFSCIFPSM